MKRIVVDFDDTLSFCVNRDWENATPNVELINKLNALSNNGWIVDVYTARGSLSCSSREEADAKNRPQIEKWLHQHGLIYNKLSFDKPLATWYIDDKGITPEDFISNVEIVQLTGGLSGADVYAEGNFVYKTAKDSAAAVSWYAAAAATRLARTPKIHSLIGDTIKMDFIEGDHFDAAVKMHQSAKTIGEAMDVLYRMYQFELIKNPVSSYTDRIKHHTDKLGISSSWAPYLDMVEKFLETTPETFSHGDFSSSNLIFNKEGLTLIDPLYKPEQFGNAIIDAAKLYGSYWIANDAYSRVSRNLLSSIIINFNLKPTDTAIIQLLAACELLRTVTYGDNVRLNRIQQFIDSLGISGVKINYVF